MFRTPLQLFADLVVCCDYILIFFSCHFFYLLVKGLIVDRVKTFLLNVIMQLLNILEPPGYFEINFYVPKKSKYRPYTSFRTMNQVDYLLDCDVEDNRTSYVQEFVEQNPGRYHLFQDNPLNEGCFLHSIVNKEGKNNIYY